MSWSLSRILMGADERFQKSILVPTWEEWKQKDQLRDNCSGSSKTRQANLSGSGGGVRYGRVGVYLEGRVAEPDARLGIRKGRLLSLEMEAGREGRRERK